MLTCHCCGNCGVIRSKESLQDAKAPSVFSHRVGRGESQEGEQDDEEHAEAYSGGGKERVL